MSFRHPRMRTKTTSVSPTKSAASSSQQASRSSSPTKSKSRVYLLDPSDLPHKRRYACTKDLFLPGPQKLVTLPGIFSFTHPASSRGSNPRTTGDDRTPIADDPFSEPVDFSDTFYMPDQAGELRVHHPSKQERQWATWTITVIPSLVQPYISLLHETRPLHNAPRMPANETSCQFSVRHLKILCVYFDRKSSTTFLLCTKC